MLDGYLGNVLESLYVNIKLLKSFPLCVYSSVVVRICFLYFDCVEDVLSIALHDFCCWSIAYISISE